MTTEEIVALDKLRMQAQAAYETPYCRLNAEDIKDIIEFVLRCPKLRKRLKDIIKDSRKEMADSIAAEANRLVGRAIPQRGCLNEPNKRNSKLT